VRVFFAFVLVEVAGGQDGLYEFKGGLIDEGLVFAGVGHTVVGDDAGVVGVA
jgi:hypothetical protein